MRRVAHVTAALVLVLAASACVPVEAPAPGVPGGGAGGVNQCGALDLQYLVGAPARDLDAIRFNKPVRVIYPDTAVTMDYNPERLNFEVDRTGRISRVNCG